MHPPIYVPSPFSYLLHVVVKLLSTESSKKVSKKNRKEQHAEFRDIEEYLVDGQQPQAWEDPVIVHSGSVHVRSFQQARVLDTLRYLLGSGFPSILVAYSIVRYRVYVTSALCPG